jgi:hypothetical protein
MILVARSASPSVQRSQAARLSVALLGECEDLAEAEVKLCWAMEFRRLLIADTFEDRV